MDAILSALKEERKHAEKLLKRYKQEFASLPAGTFFIRKLRNGQYCYITQSEQGNIRQVYIGKLEVDDIAKYKEKMARKRKLRELIKKAMQQKLFLEKALRHARKKG